MEVWKDIPGYEGIYQASTLGNIRTVEGKTTSNKRFATRCWKSRVLKSKGYNAKTGKRVSLWRDGKAKDWLVARLVATTFLGCPPDGFTVNHKDGNRFNNTIENLEWLSLADNIRHGFSTGLYHNQISVTLKNGTEEINFKSMSKCDAFLGRHCGYTSEKMKLGKPITDARGNLYQVEKGQQT